MPGTGWNGWLMPAQYPLIVNPPQQRLWTANARTVDGLMLDRLGDGGYDLGARAKQIRDSLRGNEHFSPASMLAIQLDDRALFLARWRQLLEMTLNRAEAAPWHAEMQQALRDWDGHASTSSVAYRLVRAFRQEVIDSVLDGFAAAVRAATARFRAAKVESGRTRRVDIDRAPSTTSVAACLCRLGRFAEQLCQTRGGAYAKTTGRHRGS